MGLGRAGLGGGGSSHHRSILCAFVGRDEPGGGGVCGHAGGGEETAPSVTSWGGGLHAWAENHRGDGWGRDGDLEGGKVEEAEWWVGGWVGGWGRGSPAVRLEFMYQNLFFG